MSITSCIHCNIALSTENDYVTCRCKSSIHHKCLHPYKSLPYTWINSNPVNKHIVSIMNSPSFQYICKKCTTIEQPLPIITNTNIISPKESTDITILMTDINSQLKSHDKILSNIIKQLNTTNSNIINKLTELTKLTSYTSSQFDKHYTQLNNTTDLSTNINIPRQSVTTSPPNTPISTLKDDDIPIISCLNTHYNSFIHLPRLGPHYGGGVGVIYKNSLKLACKIDLSLKHSEALKCTFHPVNSLPFTLITIYRPPHNSIPQFIDELDTKMSSSTYRTIILGDLNIPISPSSTYSNRLTNTINSYNFTQNVLEPTHTS